MSEQEVVRIRVDGVVVGIVGLEEIVASTAVTHADAPDEIVMRELLDRTAAANYIPARAKDAYGRALLREFKKRTGRTVEEEVPSGLHVAILGPGCYNCDHLESMVRDVMAELNILGDLSHVTDPKEIGRYGLLGVPAVVINGRVVSTGIVPPKGRVRQWLQEAAGTADRTT